MAPGRAAAWPVLATLLGSLSVAAGAQRFADAARTGPFAWLNGTVLRTEVGPLTGGDWVDLAAADWDADGDLDLFVGSGYGDVLFFRRRVDGLFDSPSGLGSAESDPFAFEPLRSPACPAICDWDADGDLDLLLASETKVFLYETRAADSGLAFAPGAELLAEGGARLLPVADCLLSAVRLAPTDLPSLFISCPDGRLLLARRADAQGIESPKEVLPAGDLPRARGDVADFDADGVPDLVLGTADGRAFVRPGAVKEGRLEFGPPAPISSADGQVPGPEGAALRDLSPRCVDWDRDGEADILLGCRSGYILLLERTGPSELTSRGYLQQVEAPIDAGRCAAADLGDWDADGRADLVVGGEDGSLRLYPDEGRSLEGVFGPGRPITAGATPWREEGGFTWPAIMPRTGGRLAMLAVGGGSGVVWLLGREGDAVSHATKASAGGRAITLAPMVTVTACDYNLDGDTDLFLGARSRPGEPLGATQPIIYLENGAGPDAPPVFSKAAQIELYTGGATDGTPLEEAGTLRPYSLSVVDWLVGGNPEFAVVGAQGVDLFTTPARRSVYPTLFLALGEGSRLLPPVYSCRLAPLYGRTGLLVGTEAYGLLCWYPRAAWDELDRATSDR